jgi:hypothetical protein
VEGIDDTPLLCCPLDGQMRFARWSLIGSSFVRPKNAESRPGFPGRPSRGQSPLAFAAPKYPPPDCACYRRWARRTY